MEAVLPPLHPYYPASLDLPTWQPLAIPFEKILATFFTACGVVLGLGWWLTGVCMCCPASCLAEAVACLVINSGTAFGCWCCCRQGKVPEHRRAQHGLLVPVLRADPPHHRG